MGVMKLKTKSQGWRNCFIRGMTQKSSKYAGGKESHGVDETEILVARKKKTASSGG